MGKLRNHIAIKDEEGNLRNYNVEAMFDMGDKSFALLTNKEESLIMKVEDDELIGLASEEERKSLIDAYQIAVDGTPADNYDLE